MRGSRSAGDESPSASSGLGPPVDGHDELAFGGQLRRLRTRAGLTREVLAERADLSVATLAALEGGQRRRPHPHTVVALATALGLAGAERTALLELASDSPTLVGAAAPEKAQRTTRPTTRVRLPVPPTELIGRDRDIETATGLLEPVGSHVRLLTLVGPGGVGKTRLAVAVAGALADAFPDGVVFVDLAPLRDDRLVAATIARALELRDSGGRSARELLLDYLRERQALLVLDNFEHLLGAAPLVAELLEKCTKLTVLVTSRAVLRLRAERRLPVAPLPTPQADVRATDLLELGPAVNLFVRRARAVAPDFALDERSGPAVAAICRRLDGMPLAIELAAARAAVLRPDALLGRLEHRLALLVGGPPDLPERQQTLRQTLAWSHDALGHREQALFRRLAVFVGGWTLEAAEAVCVGAELSADQVLGALGDLIDSSLVQQAPTTQSEPRFGMLETIREFALEQLEASGEAEQIRARHFDWCLRYAEALEPELRGPRQHQVMSRLALEADNMRLALDWALGRVSTPAGAGWEAESSMRLAAAMAWVWEARGYAAEGRARLTGLLALPDAGRSRARATALLRLAFLAWAQGDYRAHQRHTAEALSLARELGEEAGIAAAVCELGVAAVHEGRYDEGQALLEDSLVRYGALGDRWGIALVHQRLAGIAMHRGEYSAAERLFAEALDLRRLLGDCAGVAHVLSNMGWMGLYRGDLAAATAWQEESLAIRRELGDRREIAVSLTALGRVAFASGESSRARALYRESLPLHHALGNQWGLALALEGLVRVSAEARPTPAARLAGAAARLRLVIGRMMPPADRADYDQVLAGLGAALGAAAFTAAWADGETMPLDQALGEALALAEPG